MRPLQRSLGVSWLQLGCLSWALGACPASTTTAARSQPAPPSPSDRAAPPAPDTSAARVPDAAPAAPPAPTAVSCLGNQPGRDLGAGCWFPGTSCQGRGGAPIEPFALQGNVVSGRSVHGGCNFSTFALVYEPGTDPLRVRVCAVMSTPMDCPATVVDGARWDLSALLAEQHSARAVLLPTTERRRP